MAATSEIAKYRRTAKAPPRRPTAQPPISGAVQGADGLWRLGNMIVPTKDTMGLYRAYCAKNHPEYKEYGEKLQADAQKTWEELAGASRS